MTECEIALHRSMKRILLGNNVIYMPTKQKMAIMA